MKRALILLAAATLTAAGCSSGSDAASDTSTTTRVDGSTTTTAASTTTAPPKPLADQTAPPSINGLTVQGDTLWVASIGGNQIVQVDRTTGKILQRFATPGAGPDDVAVGPDGAVYSTGFANGEVGRISDGSYEVVTTLPGKAINPIEFSDDGTLWIGTFGPKGELYRVPTDGSAPTKVASNLPDINAFGRTTDGTLLAPAGGIAGPGSVVRIDPKTGKTTTVVSGLPPVLAGTTDSKGRFFALANTTGDVIAIDAKAGTSKVVHAKVKGAPFDNLAFADDGTLYLSSFVSPTVTEVRSDGSQRLINLGDS